jgi:ABC-2 type transport system permease protein
MLIVTSLVLLMNGLSVSMLWQQISFFQMSMLLLYHLFAAHTLWPAPVYCWLLLVSGWARRAVFLWAILPVIAIGGLERILFHSTHFVMLVASRFMGAAHSSTMDSPDVFPTNPMIHITPFKYLASPGLWIGLLVAAAFLYMAARLRRSRGPV